MKVLLLNGSPKASGNTAYALSQMAEVFTAEGVETEILHVGNQPIRGCIACGSCRKTGKCVFDDAVNQAAEAFRQADGLVAASPVYYASANATLVAFLDRLFYSTGFDKRMKVGASVVVARRGGCSATFDELNKYFTISGMPVASSHYWNSVHGRAPGEAAQDLEGIATVRNLAKNMTFLMKSIALGKEKFGLPELDPVYPHPLHPLRRSVTMLCTVTDIRGDYAYVRYDDTGVVSEVAIALLPFGVDVGDQLKFENYEFTRV